MHEELLDFVARTARPAADWKASVIPWADFAVARAADLEGLRPGEHFYLLKGAQELRRAIEAPVESEHDESRGKIASLCAYLHANASCLHKNVIPEWETQAHRAAQDIVQAALRIIISMDHDYGDLSSY